MLNWPWKRFEAFYIAFLKRRSVEELEKRKMALVTGLWANDGLNDEKGTRSQALEQLDSQFEEAKKIVYMGRKEQEAMRDQHRFTKEDEENPFLRPAIEATRRLDTPRNDEGTVDEAVKDDPRKDLDQL